MTDDKQGAHIVQVQNPDGTWPSETQPMTMTTTNAPAAQLEPCPFCGAELELLGDGWEDVQPELCYYKHPENDCSMFAGHEFDSPIGWNRRARSVPREPNEAMLKAGAMCEWSGGYDRQGSHASGEYEEYTMSLRDAFGDNGCESAAKEIWQAMHDAATGGKHD